LITSIMRFVLFLAALGVVTHGATLAAENPAASVFKIAAGNLGYFFFGVVIWAAAITSVVGASFTSISFWKTLNPVVAQNEKIFISGFIILSTLIFVGVGNPVTLLILAGAVNGIILPLALAVILLASEKKELMKNYRHSIILKIIGWMVVLAMSWMGYYTIKDNLSKLFK